jgi:hypothetical protein
MTNVTDGTKKVATVPGKRYFIQSWRKYTSRNINTQYASNDSSGHLTPYTTK